MYATPKQIGFIAKLRADKGLEPLAFSETATKQQASREIDRLMALPRPQAKAPELAPGMYRTDGQVYQVRPNREKTRLYAKRLVEIGGERLVDATGEHVQIEFEYAAGAIFRIKPEDKMSVEEGKALVLRYGKCICCGRKLKAATSVEQGIGPVCIKYFAA